MYVLGYIFITVDCDSQNMKATDFTGFCNLDYRVNTYTLRHKDKRDKNEKLQQFKKLVNWVILYESIS